MIEELKNLVVARNDLEGLIELRAGARSIHEEYAEHALVAPEWLTKAESILDDEVKVRARDEKLRRLSEAKSRRAALATAEEKRVGLDAEIAMLEEALK